MYQVTRLGTRTLQQSMADTTNTNIESTKKDVLTKQNPRSLSLKTAYRSGNGAPTRREE